MRRSWLLPVAALLIAACGPPALAQYAACEVEKVFAPDPRAIDGFGRTVAMSGDVALVGAPYRLAERGAQRGAAFVFERRDGAWEVTAPLTVDDPSIYWFGEALSLDGTTAAIAAPIADWTECGPYGEICTKGVVFVFEKRDGSWTRTARIQPDDLSPGARFGSSLDLSGTRLVIAAVASPTLHAFEKRGDTWSRVQVFSAVSGAESRITRALAMKGDVLVAGDPGASVAAPLSGAAFVFEHRDGLWTQVARLAAWDGAYLDYFGNAIACTESTIFVGAPLDDDLGSGSGSVYVFEKSGSAWPLVQKLHAPDGVPGAVFGSSIAVHEDSVLIGALDDSRAAESAGAAYLFKKLGSTWEYVSRLSASDATPEQYFGSDVALGRTAALVGLLGDHTHGSIAGAAYFFLRGEAMAGNVDTGAGSHAIDVLALNRSVGGPCREVEVRAGRPVPLFVNAAPNGNGHYALWIMDGGIAAGGKTWARNRRGRLFDLGTGVRCLPTSESRALGSCSTPLLFPRGLTSLRLSPAASDLFRLPPSPSTGRAPVVHTIAFPAGEFLVGGLVHDRNSPNSPDLNASMANWIRVRSKP